MGTLMDIGGLMAGDLVAGNLRVGVVASLMMVGSLVNGRSLIGRGSSPGSSMSLLVVGHLIHGRMMMWTRWN